MKYTVPKDLFCLPSAKVGPKSDTFKFCGTASLVLTKLGAQFHSFRNKFRFLLFAFSKCYM